MQSLAKSRSLRRPDAVLTCEAVCRMREGKDGELDSVQRVADMLSVMDGGTAKF